MRHWKMLSLVMFLCVTFVACSAAQVEAYINLAAQIALNVLTITSAVGNQPVSAHDTQLVAQFQSVLQASVTSFEANKDAGNGTLVSIAEAAQTNIPQWVAAAQFDNPLLAQRVNLAATSFLSIVEAIAATVSPSMTIAAAPPPVSMRMGGVFTVPARTKLSRQQIVANWNATVCAGLGNAACAIK